MSATGGHEATWSVGKQNHVTTATEAGPVAGVNIPVTLSSGETFVVFVPDEVYRQGVDAVRAEIQREVDLHAGVRDLTGPA